MQPSAVQLQRAVVSTSPQDVCDAYMYALLGAFLLGFGTSFSFTCIVLASLGSGDQQLAARLMVNQSCCWSIVGEDHQQ